MTNLPSPQDIYSAPQPPRDGGKSKRNFDLIILGAMLIFLMLLFLPVTISSRPTEWEPPSKNSFAIAVKKAFAECVGSEYVPTPTVSLSCDYFAFGDEHVVLYRIHSLAAQLVKTAFLWMLLRRLGISRQYAFGFAFVIAILPNNIEAVMAPQMRGAIAVSLFAYMALWCATHCGAKHWVLWNLGVSFAGIIACGASLWGSILIPAVPAVAWWCRDRKDGFRWKRLIVPELVLILASAFCLYMNRIGQ